MIADNLIYFAIFVFIMLLIGLVLTVVEFRYGSPRHQQVEAEKKTTQSADVSDSAVSEPAR